MQLKVLTVDSGANPDFAVIWLHGLGADGYDFEPIVPQLSLELPYTRFIFPHAPRRSVTINGGMSMRAWYDITSTELNAEQDEEGIKASAQQVLELMQQLDSEGIPFRRQILAGFSQGGAIALHIGLRLQHEIAGVLALSTYVPLIEQAATQVTDAARKLDVFYGHGTQDPVVPVQLGKLSFELLEQLGIKVQWHDYPMPHAVCPEEIEDIHQWLINRLNSSLS
ncbi:MAG: alpha/beta hydrolase [bacterium]